MIFTAYTDPELSDWLRIVLNGDAEWRIAPAGDFLRTVSQAAYRADGSNYMILRPALLQLRDKYPEYRYKGVR